MVIYQGSEGIALVFDDGPNPKITPMILDVLDNKGVKANFFLIGKRVEESPELAKQIAKAGHEIGNHSYTHKRLINVLEEHGEQVVMDEIEYGMQTIKSITGVEPHYFRPPYLSWNETLSALAQPLYDDRIIMSGTQSGDYDWDPEHLWDENNIKSITAQAERIVVDWAGATPGTIIGLHDSSEHNLPGNVFYENWMNRALPTLEALPALIDMLRDKGLAIKKLSDMDLQPALLKN